MRFHLCPIICSLFLVIQGCVSVDTYPLTSLSLEDKDCLAWLETFETTLEKNDSHDPETAAIDGFPHLRSNRFLASFAKDVNSTANYEAWLEQLRLLDVKSKKRRFENLLGPERLKILATLPAGGNFDRALQECGKRLNDYTLNTPGLKSLILKNAQVPEAYQDWKRIIGFYPLMRYFAELGMAVPDFHSITSRNFLRLRQRNPKP